MGTTDGVASSSADLDISNDESLLVRWGPTRLAGCVFVFKEGGYVPLPSRHCVQTADEQTAMIKENAELKAFKAMIEAKIKSLIREKTEASVSVLSIQESLRVVRDVVTLQAA